MTSKNCEVWLISLDDCAAIQKDLSRLEELQKVQQKEMLSSVPEEEQSQAPINAEGCSDGNWFAEKHMGVLVETKLNIRQEYILVIGPGLSAKLSCCLSVTWKSRSSIYCRIFSLHQIVTNLSWHTNATACSCSKGLHFLVQVLPFHPMVA